MTIETTISEAMKRELLSVLLNYRISQPKIDCASVESRLQFERQLTEQAIAEILRILERGTSPTIDTDLLDSMARLKVKALANPPRGLPLD